MKVLICSVGGSPAPVIASLEFHHPDYIVFVASKTSRGTLANDIEALLSFRPLDRHIITLGDEQDLLVCVRDIRKGLAEIVSLWNVPHETSFLVDFTGGTKVMSAALVLGIMEFPARLTYVGGSVRNKNGLGIVEDGQEKVMSLANPWEVMAFRDMQSIADAMNGYLFETVRTLSKRMSERLDSPLVKILQTIGQGYGFWDAFEHKRALADLRQVYARLQYVGVGSNRLGPFTEHVGQNIVFLQQLEEESQCLRGNKPLPSGCQGLYVQDLVANAARRAEQGKYDDAVARLYSAIEKMAKIRLQTAWGINNSHVRPEQLPENVREEFSAQVGVEGTIQLPLQRSYFLLAELGDPLGQAYMQHKKELEAQLSSRNLSLLAHGYQPIGAQAYTKFQQIALEFLQLREEELVRFPKINWNILVD